MAMAPLPEGLNYQDLVEASPLVTFSYVIGPQGRPRDFYIAPEIMTLAGYRSEHFSTNPIAWAELIHPDDRGAWLSSTFGRPYELGFVMTIGYRIVRADGSVRFIESRTRVIEQVADGGWRILGVLIDRTEERDAQRELTDAEAKYRQLVEGGPGAVFAFAAPTPGYGGEILFASPQLGTLVGVTGAQWLAQGFDWWLDIVHPADRARVLTDRMAWHTRRLGERAELQYRILRPIDSGVVWVHEIAVATGSDPAGRMMVHGVLIDISARRAVEEALAESEARYRSVVESLSDAVLVFENDNHLVAHNSAAARLLGWTEAPPSGNGQGLGDWMFFDATDHPFALPEALVGQLDAGRSETALPVSARHSGGRALRFLVSTRPLVRPGEGDRYGAVVTLTDVTERYQLELQLRQAEKLEAIGRLTGGIAHDFNNHLTAILLSAHQAARRAERGEPATRELATILKVSDKATAIVAQLLTFARRREVSPELLDLRTVVKDVELVAKPLLGEKIHFVAAAEGGPAYTMVDPSQLHQVLLNLVLNARDAMPAGGELSVSTGHRRLDGEGAAVLNVAAGAYVTLQVTDSGTGMSPELLSSIFEPFFTTKEVGRGTGLGLATSYAIARQAGGAVAVESALGKGSCFTVFLPEAELAPSVDVGASDAAPAVPVPQATILVIEDNEEVGSGLMALLEEEGYRVVLAADGEAGIEAASKADRVDLLITDVMLPGMSGPAAAAHIEKLRPNLPVLFMTGYAHGEPGVPGIQRDDRHELLLKPPDFRKLLGAIARLLAAAR